MTTEGWISVMSNGVDATGIDKQPKLNNNRWVTIYFVVFIIFGTFLLINLFTAVITDQFNKIKASKEIGAGAIYSSHYIKLWVDVQNMAARISPKKKSTPPENENRRLFYWISTHPLFDIVIISIIIFNTLVLAMTYARMSDSYALAIDILNLVFVFLYNVEFLIKIIGMGTQYFTRDNWNIFDFV